MYVVIEYAQLLLLGAIAGFTIFLGFPIAILDVDKKTKGFLNAIAIGILIFIVVDVFENAWESVVTTATRSLSGSLPISDSIIDLSTMFFGIALGLIGLSFYELKFMKHVTKTEKIYEESMAGKETIETNTYKLATMIALGIGAHNLSEGLAIGQSYASGALSLALLLIIGFGAHNATEGFGIVGPLAGNTKKPSASFLIKLGLIGGGPTFIGTVIGSFIGSLWFSSITYILFLSLAGGALIYIILLMYGVSIKQASNIYVMIGTFLGLTAGFLTDLIISLAGA